MGDDLASPIGCGVDHRAADRDASRSRLFVKGKGGRETGDPSTDDSDCSKIAHKVGQREDSCALSTETSVSASETELFNIGHTRVALALTQLMDHIDGRGHMVDRRCGQDPMAQIKDMSWASSGSAQNIFHAPFDFMQWGKQR